LHYGESLNATALSLKEMEVRWKMEEVIYLAGGCFWGLEKYMTAIPGVLEVVSGYANGVWNEERELTYEDVCTGTTGFRETVKVVYDASKVTLEQLLFAYFGAINPTVRNRQGHDIGSQYQTGIYYTNQRDKEKVEQVAAIEKAQYENFYVELQPLRVFVKAEEYHQKYLEKHPGGYCHITDEQMNHMLSQFQPAKEIEKAKEEKLRSILTPKQYAVTQESATESPFTNEYWNFYEKGIYVDVVSKEPLFISTDKYESSCGWPAFSRAIDLRELKFSTDYLIGYPRCEVRSSQADSHLGHVFDKDKESPTGVRYCINSASLQFIPYDKMEEEGYGELKTLFYKGEME
jgi:peptide methionine sulfoxide reductase msrA/msrB